MAILAPLATHIQTLKRRLIIMAATLGVTFAVAFTYSAEMVAWLNRPFPNQLVFYGPTEALFASIKVLFLAGVVLSLPIIFYHFWKFLEPALLPKEQRWAIPLFLLAGLLFSLGLVFCNLVILPLVIDFFVSFGMDRDITPALGVGTYIDFNVKFLYFRMCLRIATGADIAGPGRGCVPGAGPLSQTCGHGGADRFGHRDAGRDPVHHAFDGGAADGVV